MQALALIKGCIEMVSHQILIKLLGLHTRALDTIYILLIMWVCMSGLMGSSKLSAIYHQMFIPEVLKSLKNLTFYLLLSVNLSLYISQLGDQLIKISLVDSVLFENSSIA